MQEQEEPLQPVGLQPTYFEKFKKWICNIFHPSPNQFHPLKKCWFLISNILLMFLDIVTDFIGAYKYFSRGEFVYGCLTLAMPLLPSLFKLLSMFVVRFTSNSPAEFSLGLMVRSEFWHQFPGFNVYR
jgi:hypothetical protein